MGEQMPEDDFRRIIKQSNKKRIFGSENALLNDFEPVVEVQIPAGALHSNDSSDSALSYASPGS